MASSLSPLPLPIELLLQIFDHVIETPSGYLPVAFPPSNIRTRTFYSLALVSKGVSAIAMQYLYSYCVYIIQENRLRNLIRTIDSASRLNQPYYQEHIKKAITSIHLTRPEHSKTSPDAVEDIAKLLAFAAPALKRFTIDVPPLVRSEPIIADLLSRLTALEELICLQGHCHDFYERHQRSTLPALKRLALSFDICQVEYSLIARIPTLETLVMMRPHSFWHKDIDRLFEAYSGRDLKIFLVAEAARHGTPVATRDWTPEDRVHLFEIDVPVSYYGDEDTETLCRGWIREKGIRGTLWAEEGRPMLSWGEYSAPANEAVHLS